MEKFFNLSFWFSQNPGSLDGIAKKIFFIFLLFLLFSSIFFPFLKRKKSGVYFKIYRNLTSFSLTNLIIGLFMFFFTEQSIPVLSSRFWFFIWGVGMAIWVYFIIKSFIKIPELKAEKERQKEFNKYIP